MGSLSFHRYPVRPVLQIPTSSCLPVGKKCSTTYVSRFTFRSTSNSAEDLKYCPVICTLQNHGTNLVLSAYKIPLASGSLSANLKSFWTFLDDRQAKDIIWGWIQPPWKWSLTFNDRICDTITRSKLDKRSVWLLRSLANIEALTLHESGTPHWILLIFLCALVALKFTGGQCLFWHLMMLWFQLYFSCHCPNPLLVW